MMTLTDVLSASICCMIELALIYLRNHMIKDSEIDLDYDGPSNHSQTVSSRPS